MSLSSDHRDHQLGLIAVDREIDAAAARLRAAGVDAARSLLERLELAALEPKGGLAELSPHEAEAVRRTALACLREAGHRAFRFF